MFASYWSEVRDWSFDILRSLIFERRTKCRNLSFDLSIIFIDSSLGWYALDCMSFFSSFESDLCFLIDFCTKSQYYWAVRYENFCLIGSSFSLLQIFSIKIMKYGSYFKRKDFKLRIKAVKFTLFMYLIGWGPYLLFKIRARFYDKCLFPKIIRENLLNHLHISNKCLIVCFS